MKEEEQELRDYASRQGVAVSALVRAIVRSKLSEARERGRLELDLGSLLIIR